MYNFFIFCLLIPATTLICMDQPSFVKTSAGKPSQKMINLQLDDGSQYPIAKWKVKKESNTLCECYYSEKKQNPIHVPHVSADEIILFDQALDKNISHPHPDSFSDYYDGLTPIQQRTLTTAAGQYGSDGKTKKLCAQRLTAQLADKWLSHDVENKNVIVQKCFGEYRSFFMHLKTQMIVENIKKNLTVQSPISSYDMTNGTALSSTGGDLILIPKIKNFNESTFRGKRTPLFVNTGNNSKAEIVLINKKHQITLTDPRNALITTGKEETSKILTHPSAILRLCISPNGKWLVTVSTGRGQYGSFILTSLDLLSDQYLSDITIAPQSDRKYAPCFNSASTVLAYSIPKTIELFCLQTKKVIHTICLPQAEINPWPLNLAFNSNDTRLIGFLSHGPLTGTHTVMIWDTSDLDNIKELQSIEFSTKFSHKGTITFNEPEQNTVAVSTEYTTFFFDLNSGFLLAETENIKEQENSTHVAACSVLRSPITYIAKDIDKQTSCINLHERTSGKCLGTIILKQPSIMGLGFTQDANSLIATFRGYKTITTKLISNNDCVPLFDLANNMGLVTFYGLLQSYKAKKENKKAYISDALFEYMQKFSEGKSYKNIVDKYLL